MLCCARISSSSRWRSKPHRPDRAERHGTRQVFDRAGGVTKCDTRLFTCNTTFPVTTQTLARKSPAQHLGIRCESHTHGTRDTRGETFGDRFSDRHRTFAGRYRGHSTTSSEPIKPLKKGRTSPSTETLSVLHRERFQHLLAPHSHAFRADDHLVPHRTHRHRGHWCRPSNATSAASQRISCSSLPVQSGS